MDVGVAGHQVRVNSKPTPEHREIYAHHADQYELLIAREDFQSNLSRKLKDLGPFEQREVIELGAGTGRLARMLAPTAKSVRAFDASRNMLRVAVAKLRATGLRNWTVAVADHRSLPIPASVADVAISGWGLVYLVVWNEGTWERELTRGLAEMERILRPGGSLIILETLGTGNLVPEPPENLVDYYSFLEHQGFSSSWVRTDYRFESMEEAERVVSFFFGEAMLDEVVDDGSVTLPECTGIWWRRLTSS